jgi:hypothetical protein
MTPLTHKRFEKLRLDLRVMYRLHHKQRILTQKVNNSLSKNRFEMDAEAPLRTAKSNIELRPHPASTRPKIAAEKAGAKNVSAEKEHQAALAAATNSTSAELLRMRRKLADQFHEKRDAEESIKPLTLKYGLLTLELEKHSAEDESPQVCNIPMDRLSIKSEIATFEAKKNRAEKAATMLSEDTDAARESLSGCPGRHD